MRYCLIVALAYLLGTSNLAYYLSLGMKKDIKNNGSGNLGASNAAILLGWPAGIIVAVHDIGKAALAVILADLFFPGLEYAGAVAGVAAVLVHIFPFYLSFRGGKGFAAFLGMTLALDWKLTLVLLVAVLILTLITDYLVVGTVAATVATPIYLGIAAQSWIFAGIIFVATAVILWKHRMNFVRIVKGTEIGLRATAKGKHRI